MARPTGFAAAVSCLTLALASSASATTYYATPTGSGSACSQAEPCDLPTAVGVAVTGDVVSVGSGSYALADTIWIDQPGVTIAGTPGAERPVIESAGQVIYTPQGDLRLRDLRISAAAPVSPVIRAASATLDRVDIATTSGSYQVISARDLKLRDSVVRSATQGGVAIVTANATIVGSTIIANAHSASRAIGIARSYFGESPAVTRIGNSILIGGTHSIEAAEAGVDLSIDYSSYTTILGDGAPGVTTHVGTHNVGAPLLVDLPGRTDIRQADGSPTINAGKPGELTTGSDYEGGPRLLGSAPDIGAHEIETTPGALATAADLVTDSRARLRGTITPGDRSDTRYSFEILSPAALATVTAPVSFSGIDQRMVSTTMTFPPSTTFTYRVVATNGFGTTYSEEQSFRTAPPRPRVGHDPQRQVLHRALQPQQACTRRGGPHSPSAGTDLRRCVQAQRDHGYPLHQSHAPRAHELHPGCRQPDGAHRRRHTRRPPARTRPLPDPGDPDRPCVGPSRHISDRRLHSRALNA
jgi:hypothetical protein